MPFKPGQSGNPNGRPRKSYALTDLLDSCWSQDDRITIIKKAIEQAKAGDATARAWLFDRGYGKAVESIEMSGPDGGPVEYSAIDLSIARQRINDWRNEIDQRNQTGDEV